MTPPSVVTQMTMSAPVTQLHPPQPLCHITLFSSQHVSVEFSLTYLITWVLSSPLLPYSSWLSLLTVPLGQGWAQSRC